MPIKNLLVLSGGKWVGMVLQLKRAMSEVPTLRGGRLFVADRSELTPAGCFADGSFVVPPISDPRYVDSLLKICSQHSIRVVIPLIDMDIVRLAVDRPRFAQEGATLICPPPELVDLCFDKCRFDRFVTEENLSHPTLYGSHELKEGLLPLFAKQRRGFGSIGSRVCRSIQDVRLAIEEVPDCIFQEYIEAPEVSVDAYISAGGNCIVRVQRVRDKVLGGEAVQTHTIKSTAIRELAGRTIDVLAKRSLRGPLNLQLFDGDQPVLIEVNTRLGSASVLSNVATKGRFFRSLLTEACGEMIDGGDPEDYLENQRLYRYWGDVVHDGIHPLEFFPQKDRSGD